ncbi:hypothetical protein BRLA_c015690 [Brevibacillus laterosporus LMG 15441]|uniref:Uncharacterized protein n=1 Tax=Brevibacillus laterosporus LMG 15441 TaxID=1042163 RepID=A0A075R3Z9_BRELA|nr:hypothetical protein BRLA_c015690 [Brevibacillus laterosporus LMG 15441]
MPPFALLQIFYLDRPVISVFPVRNILAKLINITQEHTSLSHLYFFRRHQERKK